MTPERWENLSDWLNAWRAADTAEAERLRAQLSAERPDLVGEAEALAAASGHLEGFLETPALLLEARELAGEESELPSGSIVGPYRVVSLLARGGMGDVYRATDVRLGAMWRSRCSRRPGPAIPTASSVSCRKRE
jgi:hypothetical protein